MNPQQYQELKQDIADIKTALVGNEFTQDGGMVKRLAHVEAKVEDLSRFKDKSKWTATLLIGVAGMLGWVADRIISFFTSTTH